MRAKVMRTKSLLDTFCESRRPETMTYDKKKQDELNRKWCGEVVIATYDKRCYSVIGLHFDKSAASLPVEGLNISHAEYFQQRKNITLKHPNAPPMVAVSGRNNSTIYLPAELVCGNELEPQLKMKLPSITSFTPEVRFKGIQEMRRNLIPGAQKSRGGSSGLSGGGGGKGGLLPSLGFVLADELIKVNVMKLDLPVISAAGVRIPEKMGGSWAPASKLSFGITSAS